MENKTFVMTKGPSCLGVNFGLVIKCFRFQASSQTLSSFLKGVNFCQVQAAMTCQANLWAARTSSRAAVKFLSLVLTVGMAKFRRMGGRAWGS